MKNFNEWLEENHPDFQIDEVHPWIKAAALLGASGAAGIGGAITHDTIYEPHNSIFPSVRQAAYDQMDAKDKEIASQKISKHDMLQNAIKKHELGQKLSPEESHLLHSSDYHINSPRDREILAKNKKYPSQFDIAKKQGKDLVFPTRGERLYGQTANFPDHKFAPLDQQDPEIQAYYAKYPHRLK
jgi:hypothetical protein